MSWITTGDRKVLYCGGRRVVQCSRRSDCWEALVRDEELERLVVENLPHALVIEAEKPGVEKFWWVRVESGRSQSGTLD